MVRGHYFSGTSRSRTRKSSSTATRHGSLLSIHIEGYRHLGLVQASRIPREHVTLRYDSGSALTRGRASFTSFPPPAAFSKLPSPICDRKYGSAATRKTVGFFREFDLSEPDNN